MKQVLIAFGRAVLSQLHFKMLLLTILPFVVSVALWGVLLWAGLQPTVDWLHAYFAANDGFRTAGEILGWFGMGALKTVLVPLIAMWVLLPLMILTALVFVGIMAMPAIVRHVGRRHYPELELKKGGSLAGSLWVATYSFIVFVVLWLLTLPLSLIPPLSFAVQPLLWGWLTYQVMSYDALADHASREEFREIVRLHRWPLLAIGAIAGAMGAAPTLLWLGGALSVVFFPVLAAGAIWLYVLVFVFSGLWFQHYCMEALAQYRGARRLAPALKDIN
ncbi:EI24 domain-containing protein [Noviherbaspirillum agri]